MTSTPSAAAFAVVTVRPPGAQTRSTTATWLFACVAMLVSYLPFSAVNGVLGTIGASTHADTSALQWVTDAFTVALTGAVLAGGALAERLGRRRVALVGLLLTLLGALAGWLSGGGPGGGVLWLLWAAQAISGAGAGLVMSATLALIAAVAETPAARTRSIAFWAACNVVGLGGGPFLGAAATDIATWRWLFPPIFLLAAATATFGLRRARESRPAAPAPHDTRGQLLGTAAVVLLVFGVIHGGGPAGWTARATLAELAAGTAVLCAFLITEHRAERPGLAPSLFAYRGFTAAGLTAASALFTVIGVVFVATLYLAGRGVGDLGIAARLGCLFAGNAVASASAGPLQNRFGSRAVLLCGLLTGVGGLGSLVLLPGPGLGVLGWRLAILGAGCGTAVACATAVAVRSVPGPDAAMAGTANNVIRQLGAALGTAVIGGVFAARIAAGAAPLAAVRTSVAVLLCLLSATTVVSTALLFTGRRP